VVTPLSFLSLCKKGVITPIPSNEQEFRIKELDEACPLPRTMVNPQHPTETFSEESTFTRTYNRAQPKVVNPCFSLKFSIQGAIAVQIAEMQRRLPCAWRYHSWHPTHGRALEPLVCSLRIRLFGSKAILPLMDWQACRLICAGLETRRHGNLDLSNLDESAVTQSALAILNN
jgi:hypothetical protein